MTRANVDLHAHYAMHLVPQGDEGTVITLLTSPRGTRLALRDRVRARLVGFASRFANYATPASGPAVTLELMREGQVGVLLSALYSPFDEMDVTKLHGYGLPPDPQYFDTLMRQLEAVEDRVAGHPEAAIARSPAEMDELVAAGRTAVVHCVEGGYALGATPAAIEANVAALAARGIAYVTVAHLFHRAVATNAPALPFLSDRAYHLLFRQPRTGLSELGEAVVRACVANGVLIDVTHMSERALADTFALLDELDPAGEVPLIASHVAARFGGREYCLADETIARVAARGGVAGLLFCDHFVCDGLVRGTSSFEGTIQALSAHIDRIRAVTGSFDAVAIGSDLDGYIKPTLKGLEDVSALPRLREALGRRYGEEAAAAICAGNALRVLRAGWRGAG